MADGGWKMCMIKCGWKNADDQMRMVKRGCQNADDKIMNDNIGWRGKKFSYILSCKIRSREFIGRNIFTPVIKKVKLKKSTKRL